MRFYRFPWRHALATPAFLLLLLLAGPIHGGAEVPRVNVANGGVSSLRWHGLEVAGDRAFAVDRVVLEKRDPDAEASWGYVYEQADVGNPTVDTNAGRVSHRYGWGRAEISYGSGPDQLDIELTLRNEGEHAIADFKVHLLDLAVGHNTPYRKGIA